MKTKSLGFIGGGRITRIFLQAFTNKKAVFNSISVFEPNPEVRQALKLKFPFVELLASENEAAQKDIVFLAVHPPLVLAVLEKIKADMNEHTILISLTPKITLAKIAQLVPARQIVRILPNATSVINHAFNPVTFIGTMNEIQKSYVLEMLNLLGTSVEVSEEKMEAYALMCAMLPTYFWFQWNELEKIGGQMGLTEKECKETIYETLNAALNTMYHSGMKPEEVMDLIPVKPIADSADQIKGIYQEKLMGLYQKIKP